MPFTFSHPAIVLPLTFLPKRWFSLTGLVIGSMTPDFEYFLRLKVQGEYGHTISGLFWFDLPLGILVTFLFHNIVRNPLFNNLPIQLKSRLVIFTPFDWNTYFKNSWLIVCISILIGAASHLCWDSFTHAHGYFVQVIPALTNTLTISGTQIPVFKLLQHGSTIIGGGTILFALVKLVPDKTVRKQFNKKYWGILVVLILTIIIVRLGTGLSFKEYGNLIVTSISATLIALTITPWIIGQKK